MQSKLIFYGGAGSVTGSNFMLVTGGSKILIDCGLQQGMHEDNNWDAFGYDPSSVSHLIVTHAHLDHVGRIPKLVKDGFAGIILSTHATKAIAGPMLQDAHELLRRHAEREGRQELYGTTDIAKAMSQWQTLGYHELKELPDGVMLELLNAGHILGSAMAKFTRGGKTLVVTGDLGGGNSPLIDLPEALGGVDYLVIESVYGDRMRPEDRDRRDMLENVIEDAVARGGTLLIPAFSTERTQDLLYEIRMMMHEKRIPTMPVYLDSPLAQKMTRAFLAHPEYFAPAIRARVEGGEDIFAFPELHFVEDAVESQKIEGAANPKIILAGSGMSNGGRVTAHEQHLLPDAKNTVLIVGYQAAGTVGRRLIEGTKSVMLHKVGVKVAAKVEAIYGYSAHMDGEGLLEFVNKTAGSLKHCFVVEGEPSAASFLTQRIRDYLSVNATAPAAGESAEIEF